MESLKLVRENILKFKRLTALNVLSYDIIVKEKLPNGAISKYKLDNIPNPRVAQPVRYEEPLEYKRNQTWILSQELYVDSDHGVRAFVNDVELTSTEYNFSEKLRLLIILKTLRDTDVIKIEYYKDEMTYKHSTSSSFEYYIEPVINYAHNMGNHNILE